MTHRYLYFLLSLLAFLLLQPLAGGDKGLGLRKVLSSSAVTAVLFFGMLAARTGKRDRVIGVSLAVLTLAAVWLLPALDTDPKIAWTDSTLGWILATTPALFFFYIARHTLGYVLRGQAVTLERIFAALCVYLLVGFAFGLVYLLIWEVEPASFRMPELSGITPPGTGDFIFFSFVTMTTLGYGDITPSGNLARSLAILQTIFAVFYMAVLIARLVASYRPHEESKDADP